MTSFTTRWRSLTALSFAAALITTGCSSSAGDGSQELIIGATSAGSSLEVQALERWADAVTENSDGRLNITILPDGQLGSELEIQEAIVNGDVQGVSGGVTGVPELDFLASAYVFRDGEHMKEVMRSDIAEPWSQAWVEQSGIEIIGVLERLPRTLTSNVRVEVPADATGLDIRVPNTDFQLEIWRAIGATPVAIASQEVYSALETGVVDAQENALDTAYANGVGQVQQYVTLTEHTFMPQFVGISTAVMEALPEDLNTLMRDEMRVTEDWLSGELGGAYDEILDEWRGQGLEVIEPDVDSFRNLMYPVTESYATNIWGDGVLDRIQSEH